jgi:hypothetical protein
MRCSFPGGAQKYYPQIAQILQELSPQITQMAQIIFKNL